MKGRPISATQRAKLLEHLRKVPHVTLACLRVGIGRRSVYQLCDRDPSFKEAMALAVEEGAALLLEETWTDAVKGTEKWVVSHGQLVKHPVTGEYLKDRTVDNALRMRLLQAHLPEYRQAQQGDRNADAIPADLQPDPAPTPDEPDAPSIVE